jgi:hypothetical protein
MGCWSRATLAPLRHQPLKPTRSSLGCLWLARRGQICQHLARLIIHRRLAGPHRQPSGPDRRRTERGNKRRQETSVMVTVGKTACYV